MFKEHSIASDHLRRRLEAIKKSAMRTKDLTPEEMIMKAFFLITFAKNASENIEIIEEY